MTDRSEPFCRIKPTANFLRLFTRYFSIFLTSYGRGIDSLCRLYVGDYQAVVSV